MRTEKDRKYQKEYKQTLKGRIANRLTTGRSHAKKRGFTGPVGRPIDVVCLWHEQNGKCAGCGTEISILKACLDHDHESGEVRGFLCNGCNVKDVLARLE